MLDIPIEIITPPSFCETAANFSKKIMERVNSGETRLIKGTYAAYSGDEGKEILKEALSNYIQPKPLTPTEFSIKVYNECVGK